MPDRPYGKNYNSFFYKFNLQTILKVVKEHAVSLSKHKTGYRLLIAIFDSVDDTVLVKKAIVSSLATNLKDIAKDHWGKMVSFNIVE